MHWTMEATTCQYSNSLEEPLRYAFLTSVIHNFLPLAIFLASSMNHLKCSSWFHCPYQWTGIKSILQPVQRLRNSRNHGRPTPSSLVTAGAPSAARPAYGWRYVWYASAACWGLMHAWLWPSLHLSGSLKARRWPEPRAIASFALSNHYYSQPTHKYKLAQVRIE